MKSIEMGFHSRQ